MLVSDIPIAHTPQGGWKDEMPLLVLAECTEPLAPGVSDMRGLWKACSVEVNGEPIDDLSHIERVEQGGNRVVITSK